MRTSPNSVPSSGVTSTDRSAPFLRGWWLFVPLLAWAAFRGWWAPDEPRYAQIARECWDRGEWLVLHICGDIYPDKPPLVYWIAGVFGRVSDWSEFAMRIPSLLATLGSVLLARRMARSWARKKSRCSIVDWTIFECFADACITAEILPPTHAIRL